MTTVVACNLPFSLRGMQTFCLRVLFRSWNFSFPIFKKMILIWCVVFEEKENVWVVSRCYRLKWTRDWKQIVILTDRRRRGPCASVCADTRLLIRCVEPYRTKAVEKESVKAIDTLQRYSNFSPSCPSIKCFKDNQQQMPKSPSNIQHTHPLGKCVCSHADALDLFSPSLSTIFRLYTHLCSWFLYCIEQIKRDV